jgi:glycosyltransferase involved in cell wall biosynthesis
LVTMPKPDSLLDASEQPPEIVVGVVTSSFPVPNNPASGVFVERLVANMPPGVRPIVLLPCPNVALMDQSEARYRTECFRYGPRSWLRLAHRPGGLPDAWRRRDPALLLLPLFLPAMFLACLRLAGKVDVIHGNWSLPALIASLAGRLRRRPAIATLRGEDITRAESSWLFRALLRACLAWNSRTVVVSEAMRDSLQRTFGLYAHRIDFVPNGVSADPASQTTAFHDPLRLVTVGSLIQRKRVATLLQALVHEDCPSTTVLRIVGEGPERASLERLAQSLGVRDRVQFVGGVAPDDVPSHLQWADLFVFASESEGRPNAILEAMASGLPILATDIPGVRELLGPRGGILFPVGDVTALVKAIGLLLNDPDLAQSLGHEARARIDQLGLSWPASAARYASIYRQVLAEAEKA